MKVFLNIMFAMVQDAVNIDWGESGCDVVLVLEFAGHLHYDVPLLQSPQKNEMKR